MREELALQTLAPSTVWEILHRDALKPWQYRSWIFPRDPEFTTRANVVLDLYARQYQGSPLGPRDFVFSGDEKPGLLLRSRCHPTVAPCEGHPGLQEFEYRRHGTAVLLALLDVGSGHVFHETVRKNGIEPFHDLLQNVVEQDPYRHAERLFFVVDNGGSHSRQKFQSRLDDWFPRSDYPEMIAIHLPKHASWIPEGVRGPLGQPDRALLFGGGTQGPTLLRVQGANGHDGTPGAVHPSLQRERTALQLAVRERRPGRTHVALADPSTQLGITLLSGPDK